MFGYSLSGLREIRRLDVIFSSGKILFLFVDARRFTV